MNQSESSLTLPSWETLSRYVEPQLIYTNDFVNSTGGEKAGSRNFGALDLFLATDFRKSSPIEGEMLIHFTHVESSTRAAIGDIQATSNIDMPEHVNRLTDFYYQHLWSEQFATLIGIHDISAEFNVTESSLNFINGAFGTDTAFAVSGVHGPSLFPVTTVGARAKFENEEWAVLGGVYDADPGDSESWSRPDYDVGGDEGYLGLGEIAHKGENHKIGVGLWNYSEVLEKTDGNGNSTSWGSYVISERRLGNHAYAFARYGWGNPEVNAVQTNIVVGGVYRGIFQTKQSEDEIGIGLAQAQFSESFITAEEIERKSEWAYEVYYNFKPHKIVGLRPDLQYIKNPGGSNGEAVAMGLRTVIDI